MIESGRIFRDLPLFQINDLIPDHSLGTVFKHKNIGNIGGRIRHVVIESTFFQILTGAYE